MLTFLPEGVLGLMVAGLLAAYVSTISTHLNWGTSYLVHDLYRRFLHPNADEQHYVWTGRVVTALLMLLAAGLTFLLESARQSFELLMSVGAGSGLLYLLRWYWWRINAWSEIAAMAVSFLIAMGFFISARMGNPYSPNTVLLVTVAVTSFAWIATTYATSPESTDTLVKFYRLVQPAGPGWRPIAKLAGGMSSPDSLTRALAGWVCGCAFVYAALFGTGSALYGLTAQASVWAVIFIASAWGLTRILRKGTVP
jgi:hypothetical protein